MPAKSINIFVIGAFDVGKTEFIKSISEITVVSAENPFGIREKESIVLDFGRKTIAGDEQAIYLFGWPHCSFRAPDDLIYKINPLILIVNPTVRAVDKMESDIYTTREIIQTLQSKSLPYSIVLSYRKDKKCLSKNEMRILLKLDETIPMLECDPVGDPLSVNRVLIEIFKMLPQDDLVQAAIAKLEAES